MSLPVITHCPGTLAPGFTTYSPRCLRRTFDGKKVSHLLPYLPPQKSEVDAAMFLENRKRISISGVQEKLSLLLEKNQLRLTRKGEQGQYILKPIPRDVRVPEQVPANEHLTMQLAQQVYKLNTAENALIFFQDGEPAYITKRFDIKKDGSKHLQEDFASLTGRTRQTSGRDFKYEGSYEAVAALIRRLVPAYQVELEKYFALILFNYLFSNGDAHLKNFSLIDTEYGDYVLTPAYDLMCTRLHVDDSYFALQQGLFVDEFETESFRANGFYAYDDFFIFAQRIGLPEKRAVKILDRYRQDYQATRGLINSSYLRPDLKEAYSTFYYERLKMLNYSFTAKALK